MTIYGLVDPRTNVVRYVGRTINLRGRVSAHLGTGSTSPRLLKSWVSELRQLGLVFEARVLEECQEDESPLREAHWIKHYAGPGLLNQVPFSPLAKRRVVALSGPDVLRVASEVMCHPRTIERYVDGEKVGGYMRLRIEAVLAKLGLKRLVRAERAS